MNRPPTARCLPTGGPFDWEPAEGVRSSGILSAFFSSHHRAGLAATAMNVEVWRNGGGEHSTGHPFNSTADVNATSCFRAENLGRITLCIGKV